jgi:uncharacterized protein
VRAYVDSSVLIRVLFGQPDRLDCWADISEAYSSDLVRVETLRTVDRTALRAALDGTTVADRRSAALQIIAGLHLVSLSSEILERAGDPFPTSLGTLDAIHLATAVSLSREVESLTVATHDRELAVAARAMGLAVVGA